MAIGGYYFYPAFFIVFFTIPSIIFFIVYNLLCIRREKKNTYINGINSNHIYTAKKYLKDCKYYEELIYYLENNKEFSPEATLGYGLDFACVITKTLFKNFLHTYPNNLSDSIKILILINFINSEINEVKGNIEWIGDDVERENHFPSMPTQEARLEHIYITSIDNKIDLIEEGKMTISANTKVYSSLRSYTIHEMLILVQKVVKSKTMYSFEDDVKDFITSCLISDILIF